jgi:tetratricopeptide (TPR) repeat protein
LTLLHDRRIESLFGKNRRFIRCDKFPPTLPHFLRQLSNVIGAGVENPEDLAPLRPFLSSNKILIILNNAESILDPQGKNAQEINTVVEELSRFKSVCLCITSRVTTVPQHCKHPIIPMLSVEAACDIFYNIYGDSDQSDIINNLLEQSDFHALSITLLATTASHNMWDHNQLAREWEMYHTKALQTDFNESLATTIKLLLASPIFHELGPSAHDLLSVVAFLPQGVDESNLSWLFPTIPNRQNIFDKFCVLSLTHRNNGFITMLAPLRDYFYPKDPTSSPLLCTTKDCYFSKLSVDIGPSNPGFEEARWIRSEDVNIEHLLDVFTSTDAKSDDVWDTCVSFMEHLYWHKPRLIMLGPKLEGLPDSHPAKPKCLYQLSWLFDSVGNCLEYKRLLGHTLELWRACGDDFQVADTLERLAEANQQLRVYAEGIQQAEESLGIFKQLNDTAGQADSSQRLAQLWYLDNQLDAAEEAALQSINLLDKDEQFRACQGYRFLSNICYLKGRTEAAINYLKTAFGIASSSNWNDEKFWILHFLAQLFLKKSRFNDTQDHIGLAKSHTGHNRYLLGCLSHLQANLLYVQGRLEEAKSEVLHAVTVFEKHGGVGGAEISRNLLQLIEEELVASGRPGPKCELLERVLHHTPANSPFLVHGSQCTFSIEQADLP